MKKQLLLMTALTCLVVLFSACDKDNDVVVENAPEFVTDAAELTYAEHLTTDVEETADEATIAPPPPGQETLLSCADISAEEERGVFPNTITIDFGEGCEGRDGKVRSGKLIVTISDSLHNEGATRTVTFEDYFVDDVQISGSKSWTNLGIDEEGLITIEKSAELQFDFPDGTTATRSTNRTITKSVQYVKYRKAGKWKKRIMRFKGIVSVMGTVNGTNRAGENYSANIVEALTKSENCFWFGSGIIELSKGDETRTIDYGDGSCDRNATLTLADGSTKEIKIKPFWAR